MRNRVYTVGGVLLLTILLVNPVLGTASQIASPPVLDVSSTPSMSLTATNNTTTTTTERTAQTDGKFRVGPDVKLRPVENVITRRQAGLIELFVNNPSVNTQSITVRAEINVPSGVHMSGVDTGTSGGAGTAIGTYEVPSGQSRTIQMRVFPTETGEFVTDGSILYWPTGNRDAFNQFSLTHSFDVVNPPCNAENAPAGFSKNCGGSPIQEIPTSFILLVVGVLTGLAVVIFALRSGAEIIIE